MKKHRIITDGTRYRVQIRTFWIWHQFTFGINEGGGSYYIEEATYTEAEDKYNYYCRKSRSRWRVAIKPEAK